MTANKQVMARHGDALLTLAARQGRQLRFEAAVGGAMPIVRASATASPAIASRASYAILNGTTNAVLSRMEATGCSLDEAAARCAGARLRRGGSRRPISTATTRRRSSRSCARWRSVCASIRRRSTPARRRRSARDDLARARARGGTIRQIAHAEYDRDRVDADRMGRADRRAARLDLRGDHRRPECGAHHRRASGETGIFGTGAGGDATAVAILSDLAAIARDRAAIVPAPVLAPISDFRRASNVIRRT